MTERIRSLLQRVSSADVEVSAQDAELRERLGCRGDLAALEREIASEIAHSLGRAANKLEAAIARVRAIVGELAALPLAADTRRALRSSFDEERLHAERRLRDLIIQREAIGFRRHHDVYQQYVIPLWPKESGPRE